MASPHGEVSEHFASYERSECFMATKLSLHVCEANASLINQWSYDIITSKDGDIITNDKLAEQSMDFLEYYWQYIEKD